MVNVVKKFFALVIILAVCTERVAAQSSAAPRGGPFEITGETSTTPPYSIGCIAGRPLMYTPEGLVPAKVGLALINAQSKKLARRLKSGVSARSAQRLRSQLATLLKQKKRAVRAARLCLQGRSSSTFGFARATTGLALTSTFPAPDSSGAIVVTELPTTPNGRFRLRFSGAGFVSGQVLRAQVGTRLLTISHRILSPTELAITLASPVTAQVGFWIEQSTPQGTVASNILEVQLVAHAPAGSPGDHVATIAHDSPTGSAPYTISAVVPLPRGLYSAADEATGQSPLSIEVNNVLRPLQLTGLTRYPSGDFDTAVVSARIPSPSAGTSAFRIFRVTSEGSPTPPQYADARDLVLQSPVLLHPAIRDLFLPGRGITAVAHDPFGNRYTCDLFRNETGFIKVYEYGPARIVFRSYCVLLPETPVTGPTGTLPHLMGILTYGVVTADDPAIRLTVTTTNSAAGSPLENGDPRATALGDLFFKDLSLNVSGVYDTTRTWNVVVDAPTTTTPNLTVIPIAAPRADGKVHALRSLWEASAEFALHPKTPEGYATGARLARYEDLAFALPGVSGTNPNLRLYSPANRETARFGIVPSPLPDLTHIGLAAVRSSLAAKYTTIRNYFETGLCTLKNLTPNNPTPTWVCNYPYLGTDYVNAPNTSTPSTLPLLAFHYGPYGVKYGGMTSGSEITPGGAGFDVWWARSREGFLEQYLRMHARLVRNSVLRRLDGEPLSPLDTERVGPNGRFNPVRAFNGYDFNFCGSCDALFGFRQVPKFQETYVLSNNLAPEYYANMNGYHDEDDQHLIRLTSPAIAVLQLSASPRARDMVTAFGRYAHFANPELPLYYNGTTPVYSDLALRTFKSAQAGTGSSAGRAFAHLQSIRTMAYALADDTFRAAFLPYHRFVATDIMAWSQMWTGLLLRNGNFSKASPTGNCFTSIAREEGFISVANAALHGRILEGVEPGAAAALSNVMLDHGLAYLIPWLVTPQNGWHAPYVNVPVSHASAPTAIFSDWNGVHAACKNDALTYQSAGEHIFTFTPSDRVQHSPALWGMLKSWLMKSSPTPGTTLQKLQTISLYNLQRTDNVANLGWCQAMEKEVPGYCG